MLHDEGSLQLAETINSHKIGIGFENFSIQKELNLSTY
jgi:hypothetical protein